MPMHSTEIILPETEPALEWIMGRTVQKVSPFRPHALLQRKIAESLGAWAKERGEVGTEWRFRIAPPGEVIRPLVPDVAYLSYERMGDATDEELEAPLLPPNAVVEIRSPSDRRAEIEHKIGVYLAAGTDVVILIDPLARTISSRDRSNERSYRVGETFEHSALSGFELPVSELFDVLRRPHKLPS
jgi:Uma2 family endonuclease